MSIKLLKISPIALFLLLCLCLPATTWSYRLITIQNVSKSKRSFITRTKKDYGLGKKATFVKDNVAFVGVAIEINQEFTHWFVENDVASVSFRPGDIVTVHMNSDYVWTLMPEEERLQHIVDSRQRADEKAILIKLGLARSFNATVSETPSEDENSRQGFQLGLMRSSSLKHPLHWLWGVQIAQEKAQFTGFSDTIQRLMLETELQYRLPFDLYSAEDFSYLSMGIGAGLSRTERDGETYDGIATLIPSAAIGFMLPVDPDETWLQLEFRVESYRTTAELPETTQNTQQLNGVFNFGIRYRY